MSTDARPSVRDSRLGLVGHGKTGIFGSPWQAPGGIHVRSSCGLQPRARSVSAASSRREMPKCTRVGRTISTPRPRRFIPRHQRGADGPVSGRARIRRGDAPRQAVCAVWTPWHPSEEDAGEMSGPLGGCRNPSRECAAIPRRHSHRVHVLGASSSHPSSAGTTARTSSSIRRQAVGDRSTWAATSTPPGRTMSLNW